LLIAGVSGAELRFEGLVHRVRAHNEFAERRPSRALAIEILLKCRLEVAQAYLTIAMDRDPRLLSLGNRCELRDKKRERPILARPEDR
jgi:hypothetical protein